MARKKKFFDADAISNLENSDETYNTEKEIEGNRVNTSARKNPDSEYSDEIHVEESKAKEQMLDRNNPLVKLILLILGGIAIAGTIYYLLIFLKEM